MVSMAVPKVQSGLETCIATQMASIASLKPGKFSRKNNISGVCDEARARSIHRCTQSLGGSNTCIVETTAGATTV